MSGKLTDKLPLFIRAIRDAIANEHGQLQWGLPEPWLHAELYAWFQADAKQSVWQPFPAEIPYITHLPVRLPSADANGRRPQSATKYADLCLRDPQHNRWCWFEFKVRHAGNEERLAEADASAMDGFRKDLVGLAGLNIQATADEWSNFSWANRSYWSEAELTPLASELANGSHFWANIYLEVWSQNERPFYIEEIQRGIEQWHGHRVKSLSCAWPLPAYEFEQMVGLPKGGRMLIATAGPIVSEQQSQKTS